MVRVANWLAVYIFDNPLRRLILNPDPILSLHVKPGMAVWDIGCGAGSHALCMARPGFARNAPSRHPQFVQMSTDGHRLHRSEETAAYPTCVICGYLWTSVFPDPTEDGVAPEPSLFVVGRFIARLSKLHDRR